MNIEEQHKRMLYPVVRVKAKGVGGSGTIIYSEANPEKPEEHLTFVMTCAHVVADLISTKKAWDATYKRRIEKEYLEEANVEIFDYVYLSKVDSANNYVAQILAYNLDEDIAVLRVESPKKVNYVAEIVPREKIEAIKLYTPIWTSGCSLLHDPFSNSGHITYLKELIENKIYWMCNGAAIFGNSGGAVFLADTGEQVGITARLAGIPSDPFGFGSGMDWMTWMNFMVAPQRIYEFLDYESLNFLYDKTDTYANALAKRKKKAEEAFKSMLSKEEPEEK